MYNTDIIEDVRNIGRNILKLADDVEKELAMNQAQMNSHYDELNDLHKRLRGMVNALRGIDE